MITQVRVFRRIKAVSRLSWHNYNGYAKAKSAVCQDFCLESTRLKTADSSLEQRHHSPMPLEKPSACELPHASAIPNPQSAIESFWWQNIELLDHDVRT